MADEAIFALTQETAMTAAMRLPLQETSAATRATSATFALLGGLEVDSTYDTAADHADISAAAGKLYLVNMASLASDMNFTLPVAASIQTGERVGVFITTGDDTYEMDLKSGAAGDLVNGTDHSSTAWSSLFITGECVIFQCIDGSTGDWAVVEDGRIPQLGYMELTTQCDGESAATETKPTDATTPGTWTVNADIGDIATAAEDRFTVRRASTYHVIANGRSKDGVTAGNYFYIKIGKNAGNTTVGFCIVEPGGQTQPSVPISTFVELVAGDYLEYFYVSQQGNLGLLGTLNYTNFSIIEILEK